MPKRERSGEVSRPGARRRADQREAARSGIFTVRALGPWPMTMSTSKSSIAG